MSLNITRLTVAALMSSILFPFSSYAERPQDPAVAAANLLTGGMPEFHECYIRIDGQELHYVETGEGPLVILYHGFPSFWFAFFDQMVALSSKYRVVALDGLGSGHSAKPQNLEPYRIENLTIQLKLFAEHLNGERPFVLIGHDWGAALAWSFAQNYPERLKKIVAISAPPYNQFLHLLASSEEQQQRSSYMFELRDGQGNQAVTENGGQRLWQAAYADLRQSGRLSEQRDLLFQGAIAEPGAVNAGLNWYRANIPKPALINEDDYWPSKTAKTRVPAMLIWGEKDSAFVPDFIDDLGEYAESFEVVRIAGAGHWPMIEAADRVNGEILEFLQSEPE